MKKLFVWMLSAAMLALSSLAQAELSPNQVVEQTVEELFADLNANRELYNTDSEAFYQAMDRMVGKVVDVVGITNSVMTKQYSGRATAEQKVRFQENFKRSLMQFYGEALLKYDNQEVKVLAGTFGRNPNRPEVRMKVKDSQGKTYDVSYTMVKVDGRWMLRNVVIEGINVGLLFRDQFDEAMERHRDMDMVIDSWIDIVGKNKTQDKAQ